MTIHTDEEYHTSMSRLEALDGNNPDHLAEMEALSNALEVYEDSYGHTPVKPDLLN